MVSRDEGSTNFKSHSVKKEIDTQINALAEQDQNLLLYYSLLDFRYKLLTDDFGIGKDSFDRIEELNTPSDQMLNYYYHFFKSNTFYCPYKFF